MNTSQWYLLIHLIGGFAMAAGAAGASLALLAARSAPGPGGSAVAARATRWGVRALLIPGAVVALVFGLILANDLGYSMGAAWLSATFACWIVLAIAAEMLLGRAARRIGEAAAAGRDATAIARDGAVTVGVALVNLLTVAIIVLMVWRPGS
ncbi:MAG: DUF2269 family protein [Thermoleophilia bacterium]|jgi:uncharacterized membrane protein|nr:DUF2269 family protein [Thermoleophilia bacterium]